MTSRSSHPQPIRIGILAVEPMRVAGLASIFDLPEQPGQAQLLPVVGSLDELLAIPDMEYVVIDLHSSKDSLDTLEAVRRARPAMRPIVIGPEGNDELVLQSIAAGARAYLGRSSGPQMVRNAIEVVTSGSIWAPRMLLSRLIDRMLNVSKTGPAIPRPQLTPREEQVLKLLLKAQSTREIARQLGIEQRTVKSHITRLMHKTGLDSRVKLSLSALSRSLVGEQSTKSGGAALPRQ